MHQSGQAYSTVAVWYLSSVIVFAGLWFGIDRVKTRRPDFDSDLLSSLIHGDGAWYVSIAKEGYSYTPGERSSINFFPAYPLTAFVIARITCVSEELALVIVSNTCLAASCWLFLAYLRVGDRGHQVAIDFVIVIFALFPTTVFFRLAYSESMFLLLAIATMNGIARGWQPGRIAFLIGLSTACRPTAVALCPLLVMYLWQVRTSIPSFIGQCILWMPVSLWGIGAFTLFQFLYFDDALAYCDSQEVWARLHDPWAERLWRSVLLEPIWSKYSTTSPAWWARVDYIALPIFSLEFANPIYFVVTVALIAYGRYRKWIDDKETLFSAGVLAISYFAQGHRFMMMSQGRFAATCFPVYIVMGHLLARMPPPLASLLLALSACMLFAYAALFATWHRIY